MKTESLAGLPDEQLAKRYQLTGEAACSDELARRHWRRVVARCVRVVPGAEAEEMAQETFLRALAKFDQFRGDSFKGWLFSLARTVCLNRAAKADWNSRVPMDTVMASTDGEKARQMEDAVRRMREALERLPEAQRVCIKLFELDGCSYEETARLSGYTPASVRSHLQNGRRMLRKMLEDGGGH